MAAPGRRPWGMDQTMKRLMVFCAACLLVAGARAEIRITDDSGAAVRLAGPARRIVSLAPHVTETL